MGGYLGLFIGHRTIDEQSEMPLQMFRAYYKRDVSWGHKLV